MHYLAHARNEHRRSQSASPKSLGWMAGASVLLTAAVGAGQEQRPTAPEVPVPESFKEQVMIQITMNLDQDLLVVDVDGEEHTQPARSEPLSCVHGRLIEFTDNILGRDGTRVTEFARAFSMAREAMAFGPRSTIAERMRDMDMNASLLEGLTITYHWDDALHRYRTSLSQGHKLTPKQVALIDRIPIDVTGTLCEQPASSESQRTSSNGLSLVEGSMYLELLDKGLWFDQREITLPKNAAGIGVVSAWDTLTVDHLLPRGSFKISPPHPEPNESGTDSKESPERFEEAKTTADVTSLLETAALGVLPPGAKGSYKHSVECTLQGQGSVHPPSAFLEAYDIDWAGTIESSESAQVDARKSKGSEEMHLTEKYTGHWKGTLTVKASRTKCPQPEK